jgi:hypothetical protein
LSFLVISHRHDLIPFAFRLKNQGSKTELVICTERFEKAWEGKFDCVIPARETRHLENLGPVLEMAQSGEVTVISDNRKVSEMFHGVETFYGIQEVEEYNAPSSLLRIGGWWRDGELHNPHILVCDLGTWPGGYGPEDLGGLTLIRIDSDNATTLLEFIKPILHLLSESYPDFQGLTQVGVTESASGELVPEGLQLGWPTLHSHAYVSELESLASHLEGELEPLPSRVVTVVPVSLPPWPLWEGAADEAVELKGLTPKQIGQVFWHDVQLDSSSRTLRSAGLDGLLGVTRGAAHSPQLSRSRALQLALALQVPEKQLRPDAGASVELVLAQLEARLGILV